MNKLFIFLSLFLVSTPSFAYLGPGMGGGAFAAIVGFFGAIILGLWGILYYPIKRALKARKEKKIISKQNNDDTK